MTPSKGKWHHAPNPAVKRTQNDKEDRYGRIVGKVLINGVDANLEQVKRGLAWWYKNTRKNNHTKIGWATYMLKSTTRMSKLVCGLKVIRLRPGILESHGSLIICTSSRRMN